jgi:hypothetical protein
MSFNPDPTLSPKDTATITQAQTKFLQNRSGMIAGLQKKHDSPWRCAVIIDSVIAGTVAHLIEVGRDQAHHTDEINGWGGRFDAYVSNWTDSIILLFEKNLAP